MEALNKKRNIIQITRRKQLDTDDHFIKLIIFLTQYYLDFYKFEILKLNTKLELLN